MGAGGLFRMPPPGTRKMEERRCVLCSNYSGGFGTSVLLGGFVTMMAVIASMSPDSS